MSNNQDLDVDRNAVKSNGDAIGTAIILAAGKGTRMGRDRPKVLYEVGGRPMVWWVIRACRATGVERCIIVVGYKGDLVREVLEQMTSVSSSSNESSSGRAMLL